MQGYWRPEREGASVGDHESSRPMGRSLWLGGCLLIRVTLLPISSILSTQPVKSYSGIFGILIGVFVLIYVFLC